MLHQRFLFLLSISILSLSACQKDAPKESEADAITTLASGNEVESLARAFIEGVRQMNWAGVEKLVPNAEHLAFLHHDFALESEIPEAIHLMQTRENFLRDAKEVFTQIRVQPENLGHNWDSLTFEIKVLDTLNTDPPEYRVGIKVKKDVEVLQEIILNSCIRIVDAWYMAGDLESNQF